MSDNSRPLAYWILQAFFVLSLPLMLMGQTLCLFNYELAVSMGMQESQSQVSEVGVAFNKAFGFGDTVVYLPLLAASAFGLWRRTRWSLIAAGATLGISAYWAITIAAAFYFLPGADGYDYQPGADILAFVAVYATIGIIGLAYVLTRGHELIASKPRK